MGSNVTVSSDWSHVVFNYIGREDDGQNGQILPDGDGRIVIGRFYIDHFDYILYGSCQVDELLFFNKSLSSSEIQMLGQFWSYHQFQQVP